MATTPRTEFLAGMKAQLPLLAGVIPFGMAYGAAISGSGLSLAPSIATSLIIFAGSSQFIAAQLIATGTPVVVILLTVIVVNLRHGLYSASLAPYVRPLSRTWKLLLAYLLTDEIYAQAIMRYQEKREQAYTHWYYLGSGALLWVAWQSSTVLGIRVGVFASESLPIDFAIPLTLIALLVPALKNKINWIVAFAAGMTITLTIAIPYQLGLIFAIVSGVIAGMLFAKEIRWKSGSLSLRQG